MDAFVITAEDDNVSLVVRIDFGVDDRSREDGSLGFVGPNLDRRKTVERFTKVIGIEVENVTGQVTRFHNRPVQLGVSQPERVKFGGLGGGQCTGLTLFPEEETLVRDPPTQATKQSPL